MIAPRLRGAARAGLTSALCLSAACVPPARGDSGSAASAPVELTLTGADGHPLELAALRGRPLLLFVFTTFDQTCQLALTPLESFLRSRPKLRALGIAVQPNPEQLLPLYREALAVSFPLAYEPHNRVLTDTTPLGHIDTVPTYLLLDASGRLIARHVGALDQAALAEFTAPLAR